MAQRRHISHCTVNTEQGHCHSLLFSQRVKNVKSHMWDMVRNLNKQMEAGGGV